VALLFEPMGDGTPLGGEDEHMGIVLLPEHWNGEGLNLDVDRFLHFVWTTKRSYPAFHDATLGHIRAMIRLSCFNPSDALGDLKRKWRIAERTLLSTEEVLVEWLNERDYKEPFDYFSYSP